MKNLKRIRNLDQIFKMLWEARTQINTVLKKFIKKILILLNFRFYKLILTKQRVLKLIVLQVVQAQSVNIHLRLIVMDNKIYVNIIFPI
jgi:hypothetical protein